MRPNHVVQKLGWCVAAAAIVFFFAAVSASAQSPMDDRGVTAYVVSRGSDTEQGQFAVIDGDVGYQFNKHVAIEVGAPFYFIRVTPPGQKHDWKSGLGDPYGDLALTFDNHIVNYETLFTITIPVRETGAFSTGRVGLDWFNHFDHEFGRLTPFVNGGIANGILNTRRLSQPLRIIQDFRTLGFIADFEGGANFKIWKGLGIGGSYYLLVPSGPQKVYANSSLNNPFLLPNGSSDLSQITHDHGYSAWVRVLSKRMFYTEVGYTHSQKFDADAATVTFGIDFSGVIHRRHD